MGTDLVVIIPSRGRPESVRRMAIAFAETGAADLAVMWAIEHDDPTGDAYDEAVGEWFPYGTVERFSGGSMAATINLASKAAIADLDPYAPAVLNDDHVPRTPGWHGRLIDELRQLDPVGLVYPDDGLRGEKLATVWAVTATWVTTLNRMVPARVGHQYTDNAVQNLAAEAGCLRYLPDVLIEHMHPAAGKADIDEGYQRVNAPASAREDRRIYRAWRESARRGRQIAALRELRRGGTQ